MHRRTLSLAAFLALLAVPALASAQPALRMFGFGVGMGLADGSTTAIVVPLNVTPTIRVEPLLGLSMSSSTHEPDDDAQAKREESDTNVTLGVGAFYMLRTNDAFLMYVGPRLGIMMDSSSDVSTPKTGDATEQNSSRTDIFLGLALGGEWFFNPRFSLGAEAGLSVVMLGDPTTETKMGSTTSEDKDTDTGTNISTNGVFWARFYY